MKLRSLLPLLVAFAAPAAPAATVLTNTAGTPSTSQLVRGPGGFLGQSIALGFEFTVTHPDDWALLTVSLNITGISGSAPLQMELYGSPAGPDTATCISALTSPSFYSAGLNTWTAPTPINLDSGGTYFLKVFTTASGSSYSVARTANPLTGDWTLDAHYTQAATSPWSISANNAPMLEMTAVPEPSVFAALAGCVGVLLLVRRRGAPAMLALAAGGMLTAAPTADAQTVVFDFDQYPIPVSLNTTVFLPYDEEGLRLDSNKDVIIPAQNNAGQYLGIKSFSPMPASGGAAASFTLSSTNGKRFKVRSLRLHPSGPAPFGSNVSVTFWAAYGNGNVFSLTAQSGTATAGTLVTFGSQFENLTSFYWTRSGTNAHQISELTVEFDGTLSLPQLSTFSEAGGAASISVSLTHPRSVDTPLTYQISTTTSASPPGDFTLPGGSATGSITIPAGQTEARLQVPLVNDTGIEPLEKFQVVFTSTTPGATFANGFSDAIAEVQIASDDGITNFAGWMTAHGLTGNAALPNADPNGDGVSNIESWLCRINPAGPSPQAWLDRRASYFVTASNVPGLRLTVPTPLPSDVRMIFEESTGPAAFSEQTRRSGFATGSLWTGTGASRVVEANTLTARTITFPGSATRSARPRAFFRMKYELVSSGGD